MLGKERQTIQYFSGHVNGICHLIGEIVTLKINAGVQKSCCAEEKTENVKINILTLEKDKAQLSELKFLVGW